MGNASSTDEIKLGQAIGEGSYGEVFKAVWRGKQVAAKRIRRVFFEHDQDGSQREAFLQKFKTEWEILSRLNHRNIVKYYTVILPPSPETPIIVTELLHCDLARLLRDSNKVPKIAFLVAVTIMLDVAEGLKYLHALKPQLVHRDLASKNILLTRDKHATIADMGLAKAFPHGAMMATAVPGTPVYAAPETYPRRRPAGGFDPKAVYTEKIDIFSFGALLLEVIVGHLPSYMPDPVLPGGEVIPEYIRRSEDLEQMGLDHPLHNLVLKCLENDPELRPRAESIADQLRKLTKKAEPRQVSGSPPSDAFAMEHEYKFKIVVLGESGVGKTCIVKRFLNPDVALPDDEIPGTIDPGEHFERLQYRGKSVHLHIVDTAGQGRFRSADNLVPQVFRRVRGVLIVFDVTSQMSFLEVRNWLEVARNRCGEDVKMILVGNKTDEGERWVESRDASQFAEKHNMFYIETSAKRRENIDELFSHLMSLMIQDKDARQLERDPLAFHTADGPGGSHLPTTPCEITAREVSPRRVFVPGDSITLDNVDVRNMSAGRASGQTPTQPAEEARSFWSKCCTVL